MREAVIDPKRRERRGGAILWWWGLLRRFLVSPPATVATVTAALTLSGLILRDYAFRPAFNGGFDASRPELTSLEQVSGEAAAEPAAPRPLQAALGPGAALGPAGAAGRAYSPRSLGTAFSAGRPAASSRAAAGESLNSAPPSAGSPRADRGKAAPSGARTVAVQASGRSPAGTPGGALGDPRLKGLRAMERSWKDKSRKRNTGLTAGASPALDRLKGMAKALEANRGRRSESEGSIHKREWDAAAHTDRAILATDNATYRRNVREEVAGRPEAMTWEDEGGPILQAEPAEEGAQAAAPAAALPAEARAARGLAGTAAVLLPIASLLLLGSYQLSRDPAFKSVSRGTAFAALSASAAAAAVGAGVLLQGEPLPGGLLTGVGALMTNLSFDQLRDEPPQPADVPPAS